MLSKGLLIKKISDDGNCLFGAVADQAYADPALHAELRKQCLDYMVGPQPILLPPNKQRSRRSLACVSCVVCRVSCRVARRIGEGSGPLLAVRDGGLRGLCAAQAVPGRLRQQPGDPGPLRDARPAHRSLFLRLRLAIAVCRVVCRAVLTHTAVLLAEPMNTFQGAGGGGARPIRISYHRGNHYNSLRSLDPTTEEAPLPALELSSGAVAATTAPPSQATPAGEGENACFLCGQQCVDYEDLQIHMFTTCEKKDLL